MTRTFTDIPAARAAVPVLVGLVGASGSGKTMSMLRLATGMQRVTGGDIFVIDTESRRSLHYADSFKFRHVEFKAPFGPLDYLAAIEHCAAQGAKVIGIDSMSHEHEGPGGVLEMHEREMDRLAGSDEGKRDRVKFLAWAKPKAERQRLINSILQMPISFVFCFRAKEKLKVLAGKNPVNLGWMPIAGEEFVYEMTMNLLLPPASGGAPDLNPKEVGERTMVKVPQQFRDLLRPGAALDEDLGQKLAEWAAGGTAPSASTANPKVVNELKRECLARAGKEAAPALFAEVMGQVDHPTPDHVTAAWARLRSHSTFGDAPSSPEPGTVAVTERLTDSQVAQLRAAVVENGVSLQEVEGCFGEHLDAIEIEGVDAAGLYARVFAEIARLAEKADLEARLAGLQPKEGPGDVQLPLRSS